VYYVFETGKEKVFGKKNQDAGIMIQDKK